MELPLGAVVTGSADAGAVDFFRFSAKQGQRLLINCHGQRIDSRIDATLALYNSDGVQIKHVRDVAGRDPIIEFVAPEDGEYYVGVYDFEYNGGGEYFYQLAVHEGPYASFVFPPVGMPGETGKFTIYGHNLPGSKEVDGMAVAENAVQQVPVDVPMGEPTSHAFDVSMLESPTSFSLVQETIST